MSLQLSSKWHFRRKYRVRELRLRMSKLRLKMFQSTLRDWSVGWSTNKSQYGSSCRWLLKAPSWLRYSANTTAIRSRNSAARATSQIANSFKIVLVKAWSKTHLTTQRLGNRECVGIIAATDSLIGLNRNFELHHLIQQRIWTISGQVEKLAEWRYLGCHCASKTNRSLNFRTLLGPWCS